MSRTVLTSGSSGRSPLWVTCSAEPAAAAARFDLTDLQRSVIQPLLPAKVRGKMRVDGRRVLNGIAWRNGPGVMGR